MRSTTRSQTLSAIATLVLLAGCTGGPSAFAPKPSGPSGHAQNLVSSYACPAKGQIEYASDNLHGVINVYAGNFAGQPPCARITSGVNGPTGMHDDPVSHDLYVANSNDSKILVFHRGQTAPYNVYIDPTNQSPIDVTVSPDGTLLASNIGQLFGNEPGSISTWTRGSNGGTFVGNFPMTNSAQGGFIAVKQNGKVYFNDIDNTTRRGVLWSLWCPGGACGTQTQVSGVSFRDPAGMAFDSSGDLLVSDTSRIAETFELPNPRPKTFPLIGFPYGMAISRSDHHWFIGDWSGPAVREFAYPSGKLIGAVKGAQNGWLRGVAVDP